MGCPLVSNSIEIGTVTPSALQNFRNVTSEDMASSLPVYMPQCMLLHRSAVSVVMVSSPVCIALSARPKSAAVEFVGPVQHAEPH